MIQWMFTRFLDVDPYLGRCSVMCSPKTSPKQSCWHPPEQSWLNWKDDVDPCPKRSFSNALAGNLSKSADISGTSKFFDRWYDHIHPQCLVDTLLYGLVDTDDFRSCRVAWWATPKPNAWGHGGYFHDPLVGIPQWQGQLGWMWKMQQLHYIFRLRRGLIGGNRPKRP